MADHSKHNFKELIQQYFDQFTVGCGGSNCDNELCASSSAFVHNSSSRDELAAAALLAVKNRSKLCPINAKEKNISDSRFSHVELSPAETAIISNVIEQGMCLRNLVTLIDHCKKSGGENIIAYIVENVFSEPEVLSKSFRRKHFNPGMSDHVVSEELPISDESGFEFRLSTDEINQCYHAIIGLQNLQVKRSLSQAICQCLEKLQLLMGSSAFLEKCDIDNVFTILLRCPLVYSHTDCPSAFHLQFGELLDNIPVKMQSRLCKIIANSDSSCLEHNIRQIQSCISHIVMTEGQMRVAPKSKNMLGLLRTAKLFYYACVINSLHRENPANVISEDDNFSPDAIIGDPATSDLLRYAIRQHIASKADNQHDPLAVELGICNQFPHNLPIRPAEFVNSILNDVLSVEREHGDFVKVIENLRNSGNSSANFFSGSQLFSLFEYPFVLDTFQKHNSIFYDNVMRQRHEMQNSYLRNLYHQQHDYYRHMMIYGRTPMASRPDIYMRLVVSRDRIVEDTLMQLESAAFESLSNLKKRLYVTFEGEPGVDEGGVQKEFFQLIIERIFSPDYGMFVQDPKTKYYWFNWICNDFNDYFLIGFIFGLAIYNSCILNLHFPSVLFRKLLGIKGTFTDLKQSHPTVGRSLQHLIDYTGDVETDLMLTFHVSFTDVFGDIHTLNLKENGEHIPVTKENRHEFVELYADTILNKLIAPQFTAFQLGWQMVTSSSVVNWLVRPDELELFICGEPNTDLEGLRENTKYDGYEPDSITVEHFWSVFKSFTSEQKRQFIMFVTGSDRVPIGGAVALRFIIARASADSDRLPSAHTCFNLLLLPDYKDLEKLREKLLIAIEHNLGFGLM